MREILFRAYHIPTKRFIPVYGFNKENVFEETFDGIDIGINVLALSQCILQQFTGLNDKNGTKIFDGDVVRILYTDWASKSNDDPRTLEEYLTDISKIGVVGFNDNAWELKMYSKKYDDYFYNSISPGTHGRIEVIGNIHDNPELLK
jgi:uncharacterized phage protein (TIGR01671 family)